MVSKRSISHAMNTLSLIITLELLILIKRKGWMQSFYYSIEVPSSKLYVFYEFLDDGIEVSACLLILVLVSIEPRLVVVRLKIPEE